MDENKSEYQQQHLLPSLNTITKILKYLYSSCVTKHFPLQMNKSH